MYVRLGPGYPYGQECHQVYYYRRFEDTGVHKQMENLKRNHECSEEEQGYYILIKT